MKKQTKTIETIKFTVHVQMRDIKDLLVKTRVEPNRRRRERRHHLFLGSKRGKT